MKKFLISVSGMYLASRAGVLLAVYFSFIFIAKGIPGENHDPYVDDLISPVCWRWLGEESRIQLPAPDDYGEAELYLKCYAIVDSLKADVEIEGIPAGTLTIGKDINRYRVELPESLASLPAGTNDPLEIAIKAPAVSPKDLTNGKSGDTRKLSICLYEIGYRSAGRVSTAADPGLRIKGAHGLESTRKAAPGWDYLKGAVFQGDSGWYAGIVNNGYRFSKADIGTEQNTAFYPLWPLISRLFITWTGLPTMDGMLLLANMLGYFGFLVAGLALRSAIGESAALAGVMFMCLYPDSVYFSAGHTESLMLLLFGLFLWLLERKKFWMAAVVAALASACRGVGLFLAPALMLSYWQSVAGHDSKKCFKMLKGGVLGAIGVSGLAGFMIFLWSRFGDPFAFSHAQQGWMTESHPSALSTILGVPVWNRLWWALRGNIPALVTDPHVFGYLVMPVGVVLMLMAMRDMPKAWLLVGGGMVLFPYYFFSGSQACMTSMGRFAAVDIPVFAALGIISQRPGFKRFAMPLAGLMVIGLFAFTIFMAPGKYFIG